MKNYFKFIITLLIIILTGTSGCQKTPSGNSVSDLLNVSNFLIKASVAFVQGNATAIGVSAPSLADGIYTVHFNLTGANVASGLTATLAMSGGNGSFQTPAMASDGPTSVVVTGITSASGSAAVIASGNTSSLFDSSGTMNATYTPATGSATSFHATDVTAVLAGTNLQIVGIVWQPDLTTITLRDLVFTSTPATVSFSSSDLTPGSPTYDGNGNAVYQVSGSSGLINDASDHGSITITATSPLITGSFTYTNMDGSMVAGTFSCPHP
jgi:hypothetical protein